MTLNIYKFRGWLATAVLLTMALCSFGAARANGKKIEFTTQSKEAKDYVAQIVNRIETFQFGPEVNALAKKSVDADPNFAFGYYLLGTTAATPDDAKKYSEKAAELAKTASDGERRYIEAVLLTDPRSRPKRCRSFSIWRRNIRMTGWFRCCSARFTQISANSTKQTRRLKEQSSSTAARPRVYTFLGNNEVLRGNYVKARELFNAVAWPNR